MTGLGHSVDVFVEVTATCLPEAPPRVIARGVPTSNPGQCVIAAISPSTEFVAPAVTVPFVESHGSRATRPTELKSAPQPLPSPTSERSTRRPSVPGPMSHSNQPAGTTTGLTTVASTSRPSLYVPGIRQ